MVRDILALFDHLDFSPVNTILLVLLAIVIYGAVKGFLQRLTAVEHGLGKVLKRNTKQDWAIQRLEEENGLEPLRYPDDDET